MGDRIDNFTGSDHEYIKHLEKKVEELTAHHQSCSVVGRTTDEATTRSLPCEAARDTIRFIQWDANPEQCKKPEAIIGWEKKARVLIRSTPTAQQWQDSAEKLEVFKAMCNGQAANFMLDGLCTTPGTSDSATSLIRTTESETSDVLRRLTNYAQMAVRRDVAASLACMFVNFQKFILFSACEVLYHTDISKEGVLKVMKICLGDVSDRYCVQVLRTTKYLNKLVDALNAEGWGTRASELLLIWKRAPVWYYALAASPKKSLSYLKTALTPTKYMFQNEQSQRMTPLDVPTLVCQVLEKKLSVARISHILGYKHAHVLNEVNPLQFFIAT